MLPDLVEQLGSRDDSLRVQHEILEKTELTGRKGELLRSTERDARQTVDRQASNVDALHPAGTAAPQERAHSRTKLVEIQRLSDVIIGPCIESPDDISARIPPGENENRNVLSLSTQLVKYLQPASVREHHVEHESVVRVDEREGPPFGGIVRDIHHVSILTEGTPDQLGKHAIVLDQKQLHYTPIGAEKVGAYCSPQQEFGPAIPV